MSWPSRRTILAAILVLFAITVPTLAWYIAGSRQVEQEARRLVADAEIDGKRAVVRLAANLSASFDKLLAAENSRPFYHYQNLYHDPQGASRGPSIVRSPLARGPANPLVKAYFQIDPTQRVSLPTLNEKIPSLCEKSCEQLARAIKAGLTCDAGRCSAPLRMAALGVPGNQLAVDHVEELEPSAWQQNLKATELYENLRPGGSGSIDVPAGGGGVVLIRVGKFSWHTIPVVGRDTLVALRRVETPIGRFVQGFTIDDEQVARDLAAAAPLARFGRNTAESSTLVLPVANSGWDVVLDNRKAVGAARRLGETRYAQFVELFGIVVTVIALVGVGIVVLVSKSDGLAQQRSQFAAAAAHELRTPLAGLRLYGEMLAEGSGEPTRHREYARRIAAEAERLGRVVANVNGFTRLERGNLSVQPQPGDLGEAVLQCVERQRPTLEAAGARVEVETPPGLPTARFDRDAVGHIVQNLLDNAEKYSRTVSDRWIKVDLEARGSDVVLRVRDNGPGVPAELRRRLFEPFSRGTDQNAPAGLGLGLALTRALARAQGGDVNLADAGPGAEFRVSFPRA